MSPDELKGVQTDIAIVRQHAARLRDDAEGWGRVPRDADALDRAADALTEIDRLRGSSYMSDPSAEIAKVRLALARSEAEVRRLRGLAAKWREIAATVQPDRTALAYDHCADDVDGGES